MIKRIAFLFITFIMLHGISNVYAAWVHDVLDEPLGILDTGFTVIHLTSELDPFVQEREFWHPGTVSIYNQSGGFSLNDEPVYIRGRGNSTWLLGPGKRPLRFRFPADGPQDLFGFGDEHRDWILLANHFDRSLLRNYASLHLGSLMSGLDNTPRSIHVHLYVNGEYMGVYQLTDERDLGPGRTDIAIHPDPFISEFMMEWDSRTRYAPYQGLDWVLVNDIPFDIRFPSGDALTWGHSSYVYNYLNRVSTSLREGDFEAFSSLVCMDSFVDFFLVMEFTKDPDVGFSSFFMTIRGNEDTRRLVLGPLWDFDLAYGNSREVARENRAFEGEYGYSPYGLTATLRNYWFGHAMAMPEFARKAFARWQEISRNEVRATIRHVQTVGAHFSDDFERNFERHEIMGVRGWDAPDYLDIELTREEEVELLMRGWNVPDHLVSALTHAEQVELLVEWMDRRRVWLDVHLTASHWPMPLPFDLTLFGQPFAGEAFKRSGQPMVSVRHFADAINAGVDWDGRYSHAILERVDGLKAIFAIEADYATVVGGNGQSSTIHLSKPAIRQYDVVFLPLDFLTCFFELYVQWNEDNMGAAVCFGLSI